MTTDCSKTLDAVEARSQIERRLVRRFVRMFQCDTARITSACGTHYLILGWKRNTKAEREAGRDAGQWYRNDVPIDFDYTQEQVVARGKTAAELVASAKRYKKLLGMKWSGYFRELGATKEVVNALEAHGL